MKEKTTSKTRALFALAAAVAALATVLARPGPAAATTVQSDIMTSVQWTAAGSPYVLAADVEVAPEATLALEPGVIVQGYGHALEVFGDFRALGTADRPVRFRNVDLRGRGSFVYPSTLETFTITLEHADVDGGSLQGGGYAMYGSWKVRDSVVSNLSGPMVLWYPRADSVFERNLFLNAGSIEAELYWGSLFLTDNVFWRSATSSALVTQSSAYGTSTAEIHGNAFLNPGAPTLAVPEDVTAASMDATGNYWGTADYTGIERMIFDRNDTLASPIVVPFSPPLAEPADASPARNLPLATTLTLTPALSQPAYNTATTLTARLLDSRGAGVQAARVTLQVSNNGTTFIPVATTVTNARGVSSFKVARTYKGYYKVRSDGIAGIYSAPVGSSTVVVLPKAWLPTPSAPTAVYKNRRFTVTGYLRTRHTRGARSVSLRFYRYQRLTSGKYGWLLKKTVSAVNSDYRGYTKYTGRTYLPSSGRWRVQAVHADASHARTTSGYRAITVR